MGFRRLGWGKSSAPGTRRPLQQLLSALELGAEIALGSGWQSIKSSPSHLPSLLSCSKDCQGGGFRAKKH